MCLNNCEKKIFMNFSGSKLSNCLNLCLFSHFKIYNLHDIYN